MDGQKTISEDRLQRLRPSDIERIADNLNDSEFLLDLLMTSQVVMAKLDRPLASDLDDVTRVALQLKMIGVWNRIDPVAFIAAAVVDIDELVVDTFYQALDIREAYVDREIGHGRRGDLIARLRLTEVVAGSRFESPADARVATDRTFVPVHSKV